MRKAVALPLLVMPFLIVSTATAHLASASPPGPSDVVVPECYRVTLEWIGLEPYVLVCRPV